MNSNQWLYKTIQQQSMKKDKQAMNKTMNSNQWVHKTNQQQQMSKQD